MTSQLADAAKRAGFMVWSDAQGRKPMKYETRLTLGQAARYLKISLRLMRRLADEGRVPYAVVAGRHGRRWRLFLPSELDKVLLEVPARSASATVSCGNLA
jgi:excisionase family DNA binding protein